MPLHHSRAYAVGDNGSVVGGSYQDGGVSAAFVWTPSLGMIDLSAFLLSQGISAPLNYRLEYVYAISGDGMTFGGQAVNKMAFFIKDHDVSLNQLGIDTNDVILLRGRSGFGLGLRGRSCQSAGNANQSPLEVTNEVVHTPSIDRAVVESIP